MAPAMTTETAPGDAAAPAADLRRVSEVCRAALRKVDAAIEAVPTQRGELLRAAADLRRIDEATAAEMADADIDIASSASSAEVDTPNGSAAAATRAMDAVNNAVAAAQGLVPDSLRDAQRAALDVLLVVVVCDGRITLADLDRKGLAPILVEKLEAAIGKTKVSDPELFSRFGTAAHKLFTPDQHYSRKSRRSKVSTPSSASASTRSPSASGDEEQPRRRSALAAPAPVVGDASVGMPTSAVDLERCAAFSELTAACAAEDLRSAALRIIELGRRWLARWREEEVVIKALESLRGLAGIARGQGRWLSWVVPEIVDFAVAVLSDEHFVEEADKASVSDGVAACLREAGLLLDDMRVPERCHVSSSPSCAMVVMGAWPLAFGPAVVQFC